MTTTIEVVDTAVKIGLGALISGIATYLTTKMNNSFESEKIRTQEFHEHVKEVAFAIEYSMNDIVEVQHLVLKSNQQKRIETKLLNSRKNAYRAHVTSSMIGLDDLSEEVGKFNDLLELIYNYLIYMPLDNEEAEAYEKLTDQLVEKQIEIRRLIKEAYLKK